MQIVTASQMRQAEEQAIREGVSESQLMENAGRGAFELLKKSIPDLKSKIIAVVVGKGKNGGDALIVARYLESEGFRTKTMRMGEGGDCAQLFKDSDVIVDGLFGTGLSRNVEGEAAVIINAINAANKWVLSLDISSGLSADTGKPLPIAVRANVTATMGLPKWGLVQPEAASWVGQLEIVEIGIPQNIYETLGGLSHWVSSQGIKSFFTPRRLDSHKGSYGHVLCLGGSETKPGAILLAGRAALRTGSGKVTVALPDKAFRKFPKNFLELMYEPLASTTSGTLSRKGLKKIEKLLEGKDAIVVGPGMGVNADTKLIVEKILKISKVPVVIDADGLNVLKPPLSHKNKQIVLTPHPGEMARLTKLSTKKVQEHRLETATSFAKKNDVLVVLKGFRTITAFPSGEVFFNPTGNPGMATAGMGDVLSGVIASLVGQRLKFQQAVIAGVFLHGRAGDRVAERLGDRGLLAGDVVDEMPLTIKELWN